MSVVFHKLHHEDSYINIDVNGFSRRQIFHHTFLGIYGYCNEVCGVAYSSTSEIIRDTDFGGLRLEIDLGGC